MDNKELLEYVRKLAGCQRNNTFELAAKFVLDGPEKPTLIETGCYRGNPADGQSTAILAKLAEAKQGIVYSYELNEDNIRKAEALLGEHGLRQWVRFVPGNSVARLAEPGEPTNITLAYLDSYDFEVSNPDPAQQHQLEEAKLVFPKMNSESSMILLDDFDQPFQGKTALSHKFLTAAGYRIVAKEYQLVLQRP